MGIQFRVCSVSTDVETCSTCADPCFTGAHSELIRDLTDHGVAISIVRSFSITRWISASKTVRFDSLDESILDCSERMKAIILKSEDRLEKVLADDEYESSPGEEGYSIYELATMSGWRKGCEMIFQRGIKIAVHTLPITLLEAAVRLKHLDVLKFWLETRARLDDAASLENIGSLESAFQRAVSFRNLPEIEDAILSALVEQRRQLQGLATIHLPQEFSNCANGSLLDIKAWDVFDALVRRGIQVNTSLKPATPGVFYRVCPFTNVGLTKLYEAGFRDTFALPVQATHHTLISPLLYCLTSLYSGHGDILKVVEWFLDRGASLVERWPNTDLTVLHMIGWEKGNNWIEDVPPTLKQPPLAYFTDAHCADECSCACSSSGCIFATMVFKGLTTPTPDEAHLDEEWRTICRSLHRRLAILANWIAPVTRKSENRWLVTEFIRLTSFSKLGLLHTCCDPSRIKHHYNPDFNISLYPGRDDSDEENDQNDDNDNDDNAADLHPKSRSQQDSYLLSLHEDLIQELDAEFDASIAEHCYDIEMFLYNTLLPRLDSEIQRLRDEDLMLFGSGRREMGIVMEIDSGESEDEDEEDGNDDDYEGEFDSDEED